MFAFLPLAFSGLKAALTFGNIKNFVLSNNIAMLVIACGLLFGYHKIAIAIRDSKIEQLETNNKTLKDNQEILTKANNSLKNNIDNIKIQTDSITATIDSLQKRDSSIQEWFDKEQARLNNNRDAVRSFIKTNPQEFLDKVNTEINCITQNFGNKSCFFIITNGAKG